VTSAASAAEALAAIRLGAGVDVVVTDIEMPDMDSAQEAKNIMVHQ
jgi:CheY-like chemotaxis protein